MLDSNISYQQAANPSFFRSRGIALFELLLQGVKSASNLFGLRATVSRSTLTSLPLGSLGRDLSRVLGNRQASHFDLGDLHSALLMLAFPELAHPIDHCQVPFILLGKGKVDGETLLKSWGAWVFQVELRSQFKKSFKLGQRLNKFSCWDLRHLLREPTTVILTMIHKESVGVSEAPFIW